MFDQQSEPLAVLANQKAQESSNDEYSSLSSEDEDSSGSEFMEEDFGDDEDRKKPPVVRSSGSRSRELSKERFLPLPEATTWSIEQKKQFKDVTVFAEWQPLKSEWTLLNEMERKAYEPITMESIEFQREAESGRLSQKVKLKRYSSFALNSDEKVTTFFTGGPVWAANWCPLPLECTSANQYIAISCHRDYETTHTYDDLYSEKGMIQLWCFKILNKKRQYSLPYLSLGIAHEFGAIWDMKWCPSGAWEDVQQSGKEVSRLGLLALSCSDGTVRILSICHPECTDDESFPVYKMKPSAVLKPTPTVSSQCKCLDWSPDINHRKLAAGFTDGLVVLWDLMTSSPLLKTSSGTSPECFYPYHSLRAHENYITDLNWCKHSETYMVTSGGDRYLKTVGGQFPLGLHYVENGFFGAKRSYLAPLNSCVWSVSFSEWLNVVACGDSVGMVIAIVLSNMITKYSRHAKHHMEDL
ncbi:general transcription factor 3C polypeptide 2-like [Saccoglossus kowalevskii]|uniref:General transcription factor 3C polypeptide 2-like n=1 Tax=Saccoglossus kowalevskii TaxID=10224 RepID=A0ABM0MEA9_SACKO|nr:PREDICTED: general transcription factor 3C polypeptide 2-like [Saccoglossus kowalevskii]